MCVRPPFEKNFVFGVLCRFICNTPGFESAGWNRWLYCCEEAFWVLKDGMYISNDVTFLRFVSEITKYFPVTTSNSPRNLIRNYFLYKNQITRCGGFIINRFNTELCIFVRAWSSGSWFLPAGKKNESESYLACAQREIKEETGLHVSDPVDLEPFAFRNSCCYLYLFTWFVDPGDINCGHTVPYEISKVAWLPLALIWKQSHTT